MSRLLRFSGLLSSCPGVGQGLLSLLASCARLAVRWIWPVAFVGAFGSGSVLALAFGRAAGHFSCGRPCFGFGLWPCFGQGWPGRGHRPVAVFQPGQTCVGEKQSTQLSKPSRSQRTCFDHFCGHELLTVRGYGLCRNYPQPFSIISVRKNKHFIF